MCYHASRSILSENGMTMQAIVFVGIQATGKTTFYVQRFLNSHVRISLDLLRTRHREKQFLEACIRTQQRFVVDNTNPTADDRKRYIDIASGAGYEVVGYYFQSQVQPALERNRGRVGAEQIPEKGILGTYGKLELPSYEEGFDELYYVSTMDDGGFHIERWQDEV
jgi:predicted kinase